MIKKMLTELKELQLTENFSKEIENINKNQSELKNTTNEMKNMQRLVVRLEMQKNRSAI